MIVFLGVNSMFISSASFALAMASNTFLVMGDMPYTPIDEINLAQPNGKLARAVASTPHSFLMHLGDMKSGSLPCTNKLLQANKQLLTAITDKPFIYTLGDNEWTDCDRDSLNPQFDELERLEYVKGLMYDDDYYKKANLLQGFTHQLDMNENARWQFNNIEFMTLHIAGTHNGRAQILKSDKNDALDAADKRDRLNLEWLQRGLNNQSVKAYVIGFQADIYNATNKSACTATLRSNCDAFKVYRDAFSQFAKFAKKPVLIMHGDTGPFCYQQLTENLTRLNVPGDYVVSDIASVKLEDGEWQITSVATDKALTATCK
tara:strand:- start:188 stop:1141 length:954 start_codon:yes stop_codon:yes gene_type:complete